MQISTRNNRLRAALKDEVLCERRFGTEMSKKLRNRLASLEAAESLATFWPPNSGPERCHELKGNRKGTFSIDLKHPYRLLFKPIEETPPQDRSNERQRWASITELEILAIEDTHG